MDINKMIKPIPRHKIGMAGHPICLDRDVEKIKLNLSESVTALICILIKDEQYQQKYGAGIISNVTRKEYKSIIKKSIEMTWPDVIEWM